MTEAAYTGRIEGRVQGVFFRASTRETARSLGVRGWVRNTHDGAVEVLLIGSKSALAQMREWLQEGPPQARVTSVELLPCAPDAEVEGFEVRG